MLALLTDLLIAFSLLGGISTITCIGLFAVPWTDEQADGVITAIRWLPIAIASEAKQAVECLPAPVFSEALTSPGLLTSPDTSPR